MDYFATVGALVERLWAERNRDEEDFPDVAAKAIAELPPHEHFDEDRFVRAFLDSRQQATRQLVPVGAFGQPGITTYYGRGFVIDVYFWLNSLSAIHNHPFCGLFYILRGFSIHCRYDFEKRDDLGPRIAIGDVRLRDLELLRERDHELFSLHRRPLIHTLLHVPVPAISMVIRTIRTVDYLRYFPPSIAMAMSEPDDFVARQLQLLETLRLSRNPRFEEHLRDFLANADFETCFRALSSNYPGSAGEQTLAQALDASRARHGSRVDLALEAIERARRAQRLVAMREGLVSDDDRFFASALLSAETRAQVLGLVTARHPETDPVSRLASWIDTCGIFDADEEASRLIARFMAEGAGLAEVKKRLVETYGEEAVRERDRAIDTFTARSLFAPLTVGPR